MPRLSTPQSIFGLRLREARTRAGIAQDKLGVMIGMDEGSSSARMSRYETGTHEPQFALAEKLAGVLQVPVAYFYCSDEQMAKLLLGYATLNKTDQDKVFSVMTELSSPVL